MARWWDGEARGGRSQTRVPTRASCCCPHGPRAAWRPTFHRPTPHTGRQRPCCVAKSVVNRAAAVTSSPPSSTRCATSAHSPTRLRYVTSLRTAGAPTSTSGVTEATTSTWCCAAPVACSTACPAITACMS